MCKVSSRSISFYETKFMIQTVHTTTLKSSVILAAPRREFDFFCCGNVQRICQHFKSDSWCAQLIIRHNGVKSFFKVKFPIGTFLSFWARTTDTQWRHKSKISDKLGRCGRQNTLPPYLKIWDWDWIFGRAVKAISSLGVRSPCRNT